MRSPLDLLLLGVPLAFVLEYAVPAPPSVVFVVAALAIVPLAGLLSRATEALADRLGTGLGAFLNATFGNATELIVAFFALRAGQPEVVKASLIGSISATSSSSSASPPSSAACATPASATTPRASRSAPAC